MGGKGGFKHRKRVQDRKRTQRELKARENIRRVRNMFESKGQAWDPLNEQSQLKELTHDARRFIQRTDYSKV